MIWPDDFFLSLSSNHSASLCTKMCDLKNEKKDNEAVHLCYADKKVNPFIFIQSSEVHGFKCEKFKFKKEKGSCGKKNYICVPKSSPLEFEWLSSDESGCDGLSCIGFNTKSSSPKYWSNNLLCSKYAKISGKHIFLKKTLSLHANKYK